MFIYSIPMKLRNAPDGIHYTDYTRQLETAQRLFNARAEKKKKARKITEIRYTTDGFIIIMESQDQLINPSKSLTIFSQELAKMDTLAPFKDSQNHLLSSNGPVTEMTKDIAFNDSTNEVLKTVLDIFMNANASDSAFVSSGREEAQQKIIDICRAFKSLE